MYVILFLPDANHGILFKKKNSNAKWFELVALIPFISHKPENSRVNLAESFFLVA